MSFGTTLVNSSLTPEELLFFKKKGVQLSEETGWSEGLHSTWFPIALWNGRVIFFNADSLKVQESHPAHSSQLRKFEEQIGQNSQKTHIKHAHNIAVLRDLFFSPLTENEKLEICQILRITIISSPKPEKGWIPILIDRETFYLDPTQFPHSFSTEGFQADAAYKRGNTSRLRILLSKAKNDIARREKEEKLRNKSDWVLI